MLPQGGMAHCPGTDVRYPSAYRQPFCERMSLIRLEASTRGTELALFDSRAVPALNAPGEAELTSLAEEGSLLGLPTGQAGSFLLHLYVDVPVPPEVLQYCDEADKLAGSFRCASGHIAFAPPEAAYQAFAADPAVRTDASIEPGDYTCTAWHADFPGKLLRAAVEAHLTPQELRLLKAPMHITVAAAILGLLLGWLLHPLCLILLPAGYACSRYLRASPRFEALGRRCREARINFPSIVVALRSANVPHIP